MWKWWLRLTGSGDRLTNFAASSIGPSTVGCNLVSGPSLEKHLSALLTHFTTCSEIGSRTNALPCYVWHQNNDEFGRSLPIACRKRAAGPVKVLNPRDSPIVNHCSIPERNKDIAGINSPCKTIWDTLPWMARSPKRSISSRTSNWCDVIQEVYPIIAWIVSGTFMNALYTWDKLMLYFHSAFAPWTLSLRRSRYWSSSSESAIFSVSPISTSGLISRSEQFL